MAVRVEPRRDATPFGGEIIAIARNLDFVLLGAVAGLVAYGLWVLSAVSRNDVPGDPDHYVVRQSVNVALGALVFALATAVNPEAYRRVQKPLYLAALVGLSVVFVADQVRGTKRWIDIGFFQFQPSELGKALLVVTLAAFLADRARRLDEWRTTLGAVGVAALPAFLVFLEPDFGTALIYGAILAAALFVAGTRWAHLAALAVGAVMTALLVLWVLPSAGVEILRDYQVERLTGFLNPDRDPSGATYNVTQSITAVGSGGLDGRGVAGATQTHLNYLPEHTTDFIFSALAEQRGFVGAALLLLLYALVVWRGVKTIALAPSLLGAMIVAAAVFALVVQVFVNIGMTIGVAPVTGIPLPFVSYGGSSMIASLALIGLIQAVHVRGRLAARDA
ncbi:MAG: rod shape-determining protein RodA [Actinomycetota bacterium]|nr:rod shape-determining protein RodA [Actinomycetota bacterium]